MVKATFVSEAAEALAIVDVQSDLEWICALFAECRLPWTPGKDQTCYGNRESKKTFHWFDASKMMVKSQSRSPIPVLCTTSTNKDPVLLGCAKVRMLQSVVRQKTIAGP